MLQKLKVDFRRAQPPCAASTFIDTKSGNIRSDIATGHLPVQPLQQVQVSIRTVSCRNFTQKMKIFYTRINENKFTIKFHQACDSYHIKFRPTSLWRLPRLSHPRQTHEMFAGLHVQINSTIIRQFHYAHYDGMASYISLHYSSGDLHFFCYYKACFEACFDLFNAIIFKLSFPVIFHWHTLHVLLLQIFTFAVTRAQVGKWYSPTSHALDRTDTLFIGYS